MTEVKKNPRGRPRKYPYPAQLTCTVTGKVVKTNPTQMKAMVEKSGKDLETFIAEYVCRSARKKVAPVEAPTAPAPASEPVAVVEDEPVTPPVDRIETIKEVWNKLDD